MRVLKFIGVTLKWFLIFLVTLVAFTLIFLHLDMGKRSLVYLANNHLDTQDHNVKIEKLSSFFPLIVSIDYAHLKENEKEWLRLSGLTLNLDTWRLITNKKVIATLSGETISLLNLPKTSTEKQQFTESTKDNILSLPVSLELNINVYKVNISSEIAGQNIDLSLKNIVLNYDENENKLHGVIPLLTRSFGSDLNALIKVDGELNNFETIFAIKTSNFELNEVKLQDISLKGSVTGLPLAPNGSINLDFIYDKIKGALKVDAISTKDQIISVKGLSLNGLSANVQGNMSYNTKTFEILSHFKGNIHDLIPLSSLGGYPISGNLNFEGDAQLKVEDTSANLSLQSSKLKCDDFSIASLIIKLKANDLFNIPTVLLNLNANTLESNGIKLNKLEAKSDLKKGVGSFSLQGKGSDLDIEIATNLKLDKERQEIKVTQFGAIYDKQPFKLTKPFDVVIEGDSIQLSQAIFKIVTFPFIFKGQKNGNVLDFTLQGDADLGLLSQLFLYTGDIVNGILHIDLKIKGTTEKPDLDGVIEITKGYYENIIYGTKLFDLHIKATTKNDIITLKDIRANDAHGGHLLINGNYDHGKKTVDFRADVNNMRFAYTDKFHVVGREGRLKFKGPLNNTLITGFLNMGDVSYNVTSAFASGVAELNIIDSKKVKKDIPKEKESDDFKVKFDIDIDIPPTAKIHGLGLESFWGGKLKITNSLEDLLIIGKITLKKGKLEFLGQKIIVEKGSLTFDGERNNIPYLFLQAGLKKDDFKAIIVLNGRATRPTFALSSEPSRPQSEILSHLLFGSKASKLSPFDALKLAKVAAEFSGVGGNGNFSDFIKNHMGEKEVTVEGGDNEKEANFLSKSRLADIVHVHVDQGVKATDSKVVVEVEVTPKITVSTEVGGAKSSESLGLNYKWDY